jgi:hypothetical protein
MMRRAGAAPREKRVNMKKATFPALPRRARSLSLLS